MVCSREAPLSRDAVIFGIAYLNGPKASLSFGGDGARMKITDRARAALDELLAAGYAEATEPDDSTPGREYYRGRAADYSLGMMAQHMGMSPFDLTRDHWPTFVEAGSRQ